MADSGQTAELTAAGFDQISEVGRGGFGVVYRCRQSSLDRTVAVKVLTTDLDSTNLARFIREQHAMGRLSGHPNIVTIYHVGATGSGRPYIVMEYHGHGSLESRIRRDGRLSWPEAARIAVKMAGALETAHRMQTVHRDVKPANILITDYGEPQLTDFGIARITGEFETATGVVSGSPAYTAPEVLGGRTPTVASDVYGLGATLFCAVTGHAAYERRSGEQLVAQFLRISKEPVPDLREAGIPADLCDAIEHAMHRDPSARPATAAAFGEELIAVQQRHGLTVDEVPLPDSVAGLEEPAALDGTVAAAPPRRRVRVFIADDHPVYREGLVQHWAVSGDIEVAGSTGNGIDVVAGIRRSGADVAVVDLRLPGMDGLAILSEIAATSLPTAVLILTAYVDSATVYAALAQGARGFLEKAASFEEITRAVLAVAGGETVIAPMVSGVLAAEIRTRGRDEAKSLLTERETAILTLAADGLSAQQIARDLGISVPTVKTHLARIYTKLDVPDRASAVAQAFRRGLLT
jgi:serine/threonine-protein kinase PknK